MDADEKARVVRSSEQREKNEPHPSGSGGSLHGKLSSWILVAAVLVGFLCGAAGLIAQVWWLFWVAVAIVVLAVPAGWLIGIMDDTVAWTRPPSLDMPTGRILHSSDQPSTQDGPRVASSSASAAAVENSEQGSER